MAEEVEYAEAQNLNKMKKVRFRGCGWVTVPGGPGPDSPEAKAFIEKQRQLWLEELEQEQKAKKETLNG